MKIFKQGKAWQRWMVILSCLMLLGACDLLAQEAEVEEEAPVAEEEGDPTAAGDAAPAVFGTGTNEPFFRLGFYEWTAQRFSGNHPFYQMTGNQFFKDGNTSLNSTQDNTGLFIGGSENHEEGSSVFLKIAHGLPPFSLEYVIPTDLGLITGNSFQFYYTNTWLTDQTAHTGAESVSDIPIIELRSHYYIFTYNLYWVVPPGPNQTEIFYGIGAVHIESTIRNGLRGHGTIFPESNLSIRDLDRSNAPQPLLVQRVGMITSADNFGLTFELYLIGAGKAFENPLHNERLMPTRSLSSDIELQGLILRLNWGVYSFWD